MRAEIGFGGWCEMVMSLDESPVLRERERDVRPSIYEGIID